MRIERKGWYIQAFTDSSSGNAKDPKVREALLQKLGFPFESLITCKQVHGDQIAIIENNERTLHEGFDGLVTDRVNLTLGIYSADCAPVFIVDPLRKILGAFHCGWRGAANGIVRKGIESFQARWKSNPAQLEVSLGPHIKDCCYEVGPEVVQTFSAETVRYAKGRAYFNLQKAISRQVEAAGVSAKNIAGAPACTHCDARYYSWRRDKTERRMISLIAKIS